MEIVEPFLLKVRFAFSKFCVSHLTELAAKLPLACMLDLRGCRDIRLRRRSTTAEAVPVMR